MFKPEDVSKYCAGMTLTPEQADEWLKVANEALAVAVGVDELDAEIAAIKAANATFRKAPAKFSDRTHPYEAMLSEVGPVDGTDSFQKVLPVGYWFNDYYGDLVFTKTFMDRLVENWKNKALGNREPFLDTDHDGGAANAWAVALEARDDGLYVKWDWTDKGRELVSRKIYRYYSATLQEVLNTKTGETVYPVLSAVALTNRPAMDTMPDAHLSDSRGAHSDPAKSPAPAEPIKEDVMELNDVITFAKDAPDADKSQILAAVNPTILSEVETLRAVNATLTEQVNAANAEKLLARKTAVISKALTEARILPKDKEVWEARFDKSPDFTEEILASLPPAVDLSQHGTDHAEQKTELSEDEKRVAKALGQSPEDWKKGE